MGPYVISALVRLEDSRIALSLGGLFLCVSKIVHQLSGFAPAVGTESKIGTSSAPRESRLRTDHPRARSTLSYSHPDQWQLTTSIRRHVLPCYCTIIMHRPPPGPTIILYRSKQSAR